MYSDIIWVCMREFLLLKLVYIRNVGDLLLNHCCPQLLSYGETDLHVEAIIKQLSLGVTLVLVVLTTYCT